MRIYSNTNEAITDIGRELKKCSTTVWTQTMQNKDIHDDPNFETKEIQAFEFCVLNTDDKDLMPNVTSDWVMKEFKERISPWPVNPGYAYKMREKVWNQFLVEGKFDYTYNERVHHNVHKIIQELKRHPETRQAILPIYWPEDVDKMGKSRVPCSIFYQFMKRDGKLDIIYVMRSSDFSTHFCNDLWLADEMRRYIANAVNLPIGKLIMFVSSLHIYKKDWEQLTRY